MSGQTLKDAGMTLAATNRKELLEQARRQVRLRASLNGTATADDLDEDLRVQLGPAAGSVFKGDDFEFTGERVRSTMDSNHARELKVWRLTAVGKSKVQQPVMPEPITKVHSRYQASKRASRQAEDRLQRQPVTPEITDVTHAPLPSWLK